MSVGIRIPDSTISPAAARCSTWVPITSPISSIFWDLWRASSASRPARGPSASSPASRCAGPRIPVDVATHVSGTLLFASGAAVTMTMSFDVARHKHVPIELYGEAGSLIVPDPNYFGGVVEVATAADDWREIATKHPYADGNYRSLGLADMAHAISNRAAPPRERRAGVPCSRGDGGVSSLIGHRDCGLDFEPARAAGRPCPPRLKSASSTERRALGNGGSEYAGSARRLGRMERSRAGTGRPYRRQDARSARLPRLYRKLDRGFRPIPRSPI